MIDRIRTIRDSTHRPADQSALAWGRRMLVCAIALVHGIVPELGGAERAYHVRVAWGRATPIRWGGELEVEQGQFTDFQPLGLDPDTPAAIQRSSSRTLRIASLTPQRYQAVDLKISGNEHTLLRVRLRDPSRDQPEREESIRLADLVQQPANLALDEAGTRLIARFVPGAVIGLECAREHLVFGPGENWSFDVLLEEEIRRQSRVEVQLWLQRKGSRQVLFRDRKLVAAPKAASLPERVRCSVPIPAAAGVYELSLRVSPVVSSSLRSAKEGVKERKIQLIAADSQHRTIGTAPQASTVWSEIPVFDLSLTQAWERVMPWIARSKPEGSFAALLRSASAKARTPIDAKGGGVEPEWRVIPVEVRYARQPHVLEIQGNPSLPQALSVAIVEARPDQEIESRVASCGFARLPDPGEDPSEATYRVLFWPRTQHPLVLARCIGGEGGIGSVRVRQVQPPHSRGPRSTGRIGFRSAFAVIEEPHLVEMFSATESWDAETGRYLTDWETFAQIAERLSDYLQYVGFSGVAINVWSDGAGLVPWAHWKGAARFDTGAYFTTGQDPLRKDGLELLLRVLDREGLQCIPGLRCTSRLPELEELAAGDPDLAPGIHLQHRDGHLWSETMGLRTGKGHHYNPLDERVQAAILRMVRELMQRYGRHPSFAGLRIELGPETYTLFPDIGWGHDPSTRARFAKAVESEERWSAAREALSAENWNQSAELQEAWITWRCDQMSIFYKALLAEVRRVRPEAKLYLSTTRLADAPLVKRMTSPGLPRPGSIVQAWRAMGLDVRRLGAIEGIVLPRPIVTAPASPLVHQGPYLEFSRDGLLDTEFAELRESAYEVHQQPFEVALPEGAFGVADTEGMPPEIAFPVDRLGVLPREHLARGLARQDVATVFLGSARPTLGNLDALRPFLQEFHELPAMPFTRVGASVPPDVAVWEREESNARRLYVVNHTPWPTKGQIMFRVPKGTRLSRATTDLASDFLVADREEMTWDFDLEGFGLATAMLDSRQGEVIQVQTTPSQQPQTQLAAMLEDVLGRTVQLQQIAPTPTVANPGFEPNPGASTLVGWESSATQGVRIQLSTESPAAGATCLHVASTGPSCWVRSEPITPPTTGRALLHVRLRRKPGSTAPIRLAVEAVQGESIYHRFAEVAPLEDAAGGTWAPFVLQVTDLPPDGIRDLRVRFDLLGQGEAWLDDVRLYDLAFTPSELKELSKILSLADLQLRDGNLAECRRVLMRYWPRFLLSFVPPPPPRLAELPPRPPATEPKEPDAEESTEPSGILERVWNSLPAIPRR